MKPATELITEERQRQIEVEGWTPEHDDAHTNGELSLAAASYALAKHHRNIYKPEFEFVGTGKIWPFAKSWWKPTPENRVRELIKAGALIAAEIDRLQRA